MNAKDRSRIKQIIDAMNSFNAQVSSLPGVKQPGRLEVLATQIVDSLRRIEFAHCIRDAKLNPLRQDPKSSLFDPLRAAVLRNRQGHIDEAWWLIFLATHFGKHSEDGWRLTRDVYGRLEQDGTWDWTTVSSNPEALVDWLAAHQKVFISDGISRRFSNHRKYETLKSQSQQGTANVIKSYVAWVAPQRSHADMIRAIHKSHGQNPQVVFSELYTSMDGVCRFGRLAKFDFLTMLGKLGIAPIEAGSTFLQGATGPLRGARLLFTNDATEKLSPSVLDQRLLALGDHAGLSMQVLEDSLCNWQKSPDFYVRFRG